MLNFKIWNQIELPSPDYDNCDNYQRNRLEFTAAPFESGRQCHPRACRREGHSNKNFVKGKPFEHTLSDRLQDHHFRKQLFLKKLIPNFKFQKSLSISNRRFHPHRHSTKMTNATDDPKRYCLQLVQSHLPRGWKGASLESLEFRRIL